MRRFLVIFAVFIFSTLALFSSGSLDSEDGWLYFSVAKNIYYTGKATAAPNEYATQKNVNMNSLLGKDGVWRAQYGLGYSVAMIPAVALSDLVHRYYAVPPVTRFPLEHDWSLHFFASFTNMAFTTFLAVVFVLYAQTLGISRKSAYIASLITIFATNLFPLSKFSFPHMLFISFMFFAFYCVKRFSQTRHIKFLVSAGVGFGIAAVGYNMSYLLVAPALLVYLLLLNVKNKKLWAMVGILIVSGIVKYESLIMGTLQVLDGRTIVEGLWGFLLSPGKSIFLYSPPLLILLFFWHKYSPKRLVPELISFSLLVATYLLFYASARLRADAYIWHGGMAWGPRYVALLIPFAMLFVFHIVRRVHRSVKFFIWYPLVMIGLFVQILGTTSSYLLQYRNLPYNIFIGPLELIWYDYASFIPRFSPFFQIFYSLKQNLYEFPKTISHGLYNVRFFDGFLLPMQVGDTYFRGFRERSFIAFDQSEDQEPIRTMTFDLYNASDNAKISSSSAILSILFNSVPIATSSVIRPETDEVVRLSLSSAPLLPKKNILGLALSFPSTSSAKQVMYIKRMAINDSPVNLQSLDYPDLSSLNTAVPHLPYQYFGKQITDPWEHWNMRARITEHTLDLWWIKSLYYWDRPKLFFVVLFVLNIGAVVTSGWYIGRELFTKKHT